MTLAILAVFASLALLVWSAERFVGGSVGMARHLGVPPLLIGMLIVGFGTSAPEMLVSAISASEGNPGIALGNAYGSNIANIALILGLTAVISPIAVHSRILRQELPMLTMVTALAAFQHTDGELSRTDALVLLALFAGLMGWSVLKGIKDRADTLGVEVAKELESRTEPLGRSILWLVLGIILLVVSSRILVWGAVGLARGFGVSDLVIGLTIIAVGTSLPELASSIVAARKGEHDIALGNVLGSNLFNTLAVVGIAGVIRPASTAPEVLARDLPFMGVLTVSLFIIGYGFRGPGRINRFEGAVLLVSYIGYTVLLIGG